MKEPVTTQYVNTLYKLCDKMYFHNSPNETQIKQENIL